MRATFALWIVCWAATLGCGDGVGRPIVEREARSSPPQAGSGGRSGDGGASSFGGIPSFAGRWSMRGGVPDGGFPDGEVPDSDYCSSVADWPIEASESELALFNLLNDVREVGVSCTGEAMGSPAPAVTMKPELRCAARLHSRDMSQGEYFDHVNSEGLGPDERIRRTGYAFRVADESIAEGESFLGTNAFAAIQEFVTEGGAECENLIDPEFDSVGIGRFENLLTLDFAGP